MQTSLMSPFIWGKGGRKMTPEEVERERALAEAAAGRAGDTSPVGHWTQGATRVVDALGGVLKDKRATAAEQAGMASADDFIANNPVLSGLIGSGGSGMSVGVPSTAEAPADLASGIIQTAQAIGADPLDLATAISYETAGTFDPTKAGPTTQWGQHRGLIQFGEPQAQQYGVDFSSPETALASQLGPEGAIAKYFKGSGFKPGMSGMDLYSTINAGAPGKYGASDANNGGAPGDVADKWNNQMAGHREKAMKLLGGQYTPSAPQQGGQNITAALAAGMADPWVAKKYGPVIETMMNQQMQREQMQYKQQLAQQDPAYQIGLQKSQLELQQMQNPAAPKPIEVGGVLLDPETFEPIFDSRQQKGQGATEYGLNPQYGVDAEGNPVIIQLGKDGTSTQTPMPEGVQLSKEPIRMDAGTEWILLDPISRQPVGKIPKNLGAAEQEKAIGRAAGEAQGEATANLGGAIAKAEDAIGLIEAIRNDPSLPVITGMVQGRLPPMTQGGTDLSVKIQQMQGKVFLEAFESLKGGGQITEVEGAKAEAAMARLNRAQSTEAYQAALDELAGIIERGVERAKSKAAPRNPATAPFDPQTPDFSQMSDEELQAFIEGGGR